MTALKTKIKIKNTKKLVHTVKPIRDWLTQDLLFSPTLIFSFYKWAAVLAFLSGKLFCKTNKK